MKPYVKKVNVDIYDWTVYFFRDRAAGIRFLKARKFGQDDFDCWSDKNTGGVCSTAADQHEIYIGIFNRKLGTVAHECAHAAVRILDVAGVPIRPSTDEALTYLVAYLVNQYHAAAKRK